MKKPQPNHRIPMEDYLSPRERSVLHSVKRRTIAHPSQVRSKNAPKRKRRSLAFAAIGAAALSLAAVAPLRAAQPGNAAQSQNAVQPITAESASVAQLLAQARAESKAGQVAPAVIDYERAQWLAPHNAAIPNELATVRAQAGLAAPQHTPLSRATHELSFDALTALTSISFLLFALLLFGTRVIPASLRALSRKASAGFSIIVILCAPSVAARWPELHRAVITSANPTTHIAPADSAAPSFALKPGDVVRAGKTYGPFVRILSPDGRSGWIRRSSLESIIPNNATHS